jgi:hypothetical protein
MRITIATRIGEVKYTPQENTLMNVIVKPIVQPI